MEKKKKEREEKEGDICDSHERLRAVAFTDSCPCREENV